MFRGMLIWTSSILVSFRSVMGRSPLMILVERMLNVSLCWWKPSCISLVMESTLVSLYCIMLILYCRDLNAFGGLPFFVTILFCFGSMSCTNWWEGQLPFWFWVFLSIFWEIFSHHSIIWVPTCYTDDWGEYKHVGKDDAQEVETWVPDWDYLRCVGDVGQWGWLSTWHGAISICWHGLKRITREHIHNNWDTLWWK